MARARSVRVGELDMHVEDLGEGGRPVLLLHGFPELAHSWRHQLPVLAAAGYHAIAPDLRGFGATGGPPEVEAYAIRELMGDVLGLADAHGAPRFDVVGHDWGAWLAWLLAEHHPERIDRVAGMSVPAVPRAPAAPLELMRRGFGEDFYMVWFQKPRVADAALSRDVRRTLRTPRTWDAAWARDEDEDPPRPRFWTADDEERYVAAFTRTGFTGGLNWYRNIDRNWRELAGPGRIEQPALFVTGTRDPVRRFMPAAAMDGFVTDVRVVEIEGAGHWVQQERPDEVNAALLEFLGPAGEGAP